MATAKQTFWLWIERAHKMTEAEAREVSSPGC